VGIAYIGLKLGDELIRVVDELHFLLPGVDNAVREGIDSSAFSVDRTEVVEGGTYVYWDFTSDSASTFEASYTVQSGSAVEILLMTQSEFQNYEQPGSSHEEVASTSLAQSDSLRTEISSGDYTAVVNNDCILCDFSKSPPSDARVDVEISVEQMSARN